MHTKLTFRWIVLLLMGLLLLPTVIAQDTDTLITAENIEQLTPTLVLPDCQQFSPDSRYMAGNARIYDLATGTITHSRPVDQNGEGPIIPFAFSPDGRYFAAINDGVYAMGASERLIPIPFTSFAFSPDSQLVAIAGDGVYQLEDGEKLFTIGADPGYLETMIAFSPNSNFVAVEGDAVYDITQKWRSLEIAGSGVFSPDGKWLWIRGGVVFSARTLQQLYTTGSGGFEAVFSPDSQWMAVPNDGVYDAATGERVFELGPNPVVFSPDGSLMAMRLVGVFSVGDWEKVFSFPDVNPRDIGIPYFNPDGNLLFVPGDRVYSAQTWERILHFGNFFGSDTENVLLSPDGSTVAIHNGKTCTLYTLPGDEPVSQSFGVVTLSGKSNIRNSPSATSGTIANTDLPLAVLAKTADASWYKVDFSGQIGWISASIVRVVYLPDDLPVE